jgi:hypothetical protein
MNKASPFISPFGLVYPLEAFHIRKKAGMVLIGAEKITRKKQNSTKEVSNLEKPVKTKPDNNNQGRDEHFIDIDRMVNEGLGGGYVTQNNGLIDASTTDTMDDAESVVEE